jgi:PTS system mannose-specific IIA component
MTGIILLTYPDYGSNLVNSASHILGKSLDNIALVQILHEYSTEEINKQLVSKIHELKNSDGILILCDIYGATHCNIACKVLEQEKVEMVAGLNLPMLIRAINYVNEPVSKLSRLAAAGGIESIKILDSDNGQCSVTE